MKATTIGEYVPERSHLRRLGVLVGLISAGRAGLMEARGVFAPVAFRAGLLISMIMALADTEALLLYGVNSFDNRCFNGSSWLFFASAAVMSVSIWGLYRLKLWAVGLNIIANVAIAAMAMGGVFGMPEPLAIGFAVTAFAQLIVPLPMLRVIMTKTKKKGRITCGPSSSGHTWT